MEDLSKKLRKYWKDKEKKIETGMEVKRRRSEDSIVLCAVKLFQLSEVRMAKLTRS